LKKLYHIIEPGSNKFREMWLFVPEALGILESVGTLEPGKKADILIVEGNPLRTFLSYLIKKISFWL